MKRNIVSRMLQVVIITSALVIVPIQTSVADELPMDTTDPSVSIEEAVRFATGTSQSSSEDSEIDLEVDYPVAGATAELMKVCNLNAVEVTENDIDEAMVMLEDITKPNITDVEYTRYATEVLNIREEPTKESELLGRFGIGNEISVTGEIENCDFVRVAYKGQDAYVWADSLSEEEPVVQDAIDYSWDGAVLNSRDGTVTGPSGKETYYNLDMSGVVQIMRGIGNTDQYWVRSDGVKMLGDYIMVAADLNIHPRGSLVPTSLGMGIVTDTGDFIYNNPYQLDVAVTW